MTYIRIDGYLCIITWSIEMDFYVHVYHHWINRGRFRKLRSVDVHDYLRRSIRQTLQWAPVSPSSVVAGFV